MCEICRISGRNIFAGTGVAHDVNSEDVADVVPVHVLPWYVWRRSDGFVGISNVEPHDVFTDEYGYVVILVTTDGAQAQYEAVLARSVN